MLIMWVLVGSAGLMIWQMDFAEKEPRSAFRPPPVESPYPGVPPWISDRAPVVAQMIHGVQGLLRGPQTKTEKPGVRRGTRTQPGNWDIRYTKRPGDRR